MTSTKTGFTPARTAASQVGVRWCVARMCGGFCVGVYAVLLLMLLL
jgi:hypothetical protein